jgi:hypothetical protein
MNNDDESLDCAGQWEGINPIVAEMPWLKGNARQSQDGGRWNQKGGFWCFN